MNYTFFIFTFFVFMLNQSVYSQKLLKPINLAISLAGNYGELRRNHFHMGLDFKTNKEENYQVYASEDGYVSRINVSRSGYGKVMYITHPSLGITTVYGHLRRFETPIQAKVNGIMENRQQNEVDITFKPDELPVKRGDVVAYSGNTGSSSGPHLHYEVRNTNTENAYNPLMFLEEEVADHKKPIFSSVLIYAYDASGSQYQKSLSVNSLEGKTISVSNDKIGIGISTYDHMDNAPNVVSFYESVLQVDETPFYRLRFDSISFDWSRWVLALSDYERKESNVYKLFYEKCGFNLLDLGSDNQGIIHLNPGESKKINIQVRDYMGNKSMVTFYLKYDKSGSLHKVKNTISCETNNVLKSDNFIITLGESTLVADFPNNFNEISNPNTEGGFNLMNGSIGSMTPYQVKFMTNSLQKNKFYLEVLSGKKKRKFYADHYDQGLEFNNVSYFGEGSIIHDTTSPSISKKYAQDSEELIFYVYDHESEIDKYELYIDGVWKIAYYDEKADRIIFNIYPRDRDKNSDVKLIVSDKVGNVTTQNFNIKF